MSLTITGRLDLRNPLMRKWYCIVFVNHFIRFDLNSCKCVCTHVSDALVQIVDSEQMIQERLQKIERLKYSLGLQKVS